MLGKFSDGKTGAAGAATVRRTASCYLEPPALPDVWREQLDSLVAHAGHNTPGCADCLRLAQVVRLLMRPFE